MKLFTILSSLYLLKTFIKINKEMNEGIDERIIIFPIEIINENMYRDKIIKIYENSKMLDFLASNCTNNEDKIYEIGERGLPSISNLFNGGLLSEWNFEFDFDFDPNELNFDRL
jgi:hypothetical protein